MRLFLARAQELADSVSVTLRGLAHWPEIVGFVVAALILLCVLVTHRSVVAREAWELFLGGLWAATCGLYSWWWGASLPLRRGIKAVVLWLLLGATLLFIAEVIITWFDVHVQLPHLPAAAKLVLLALAVWVFRSKLREIREFQRRPKLIVQVRLLLREAAALSFDHITDQEALIRLRDFVKKVLAGFHSAMDEERKLNLNLMRPVASGLSIWTHFPEEAPYEDGFVLPPGQGGAGIALERASTVYIPRIRFRHGIQVSPPDPVQKDMPRVYKLLRDAYYPAEVEPFRCILCVPILPGTSDRALAVLNLDSMRPNSFGELDIQYAEVAASIISMAVDRFRSRG